MVAGRDPAADRALRLELDADLLEPVGTATVPARLERLRSREAAGEQLLAREQVDGRHLAGQRGEVGDPAGKGRLGGTSSVRTRSASSSAGVPCGDQLVGDEDLDGTDAGQRTAVGAAHIVQQDERAGGEKNDRRGRGEQSTLHCSTPLSDESEDRRPELRGVGL